MSGITLSASVRQNLLSLQSTAELLSTTQGRLSSGNKVNSALDNPTNFFTAQKLNSRSSDINNLLDGIGNGVQIIQAANTGITSLQKLVDSAKSIANQALQTTVGYTKSTATGAASKGISANDLLGTTAAVLSSVTGGQLANNVTATFGNAIVAGASAVHSDSTVVVSGATTASSAARTATTNVDTVFTGTTLTNAAGTAPAVTGASTLTNAAGTASQVNLSALDGKTLTINNVNITFDSTPAAAGVTGDATTGFTIDISGNSAVTLDRLLETFDTAMGNTDAAHKSAVVGGKIVLHTGDGTKNVDFSGSATADLTVLGLASISTTAPLALTNAVGPALDTVFTGGSLNSQLTVPTVINNTTLLGGGTNTNSLDLTALDGETLTINGVTLTFDDGGSSTAGITGDNATGYTINVGASTSATMAGLLETIDAAMGNTSGNAADHSVVNGGKIEIHTGNAAAVSISASAGFDQTLLGLDALEDAASVAVPITATPAALTLDKGAVPTSTIGANSLLSDVGLAAGQSLVINGQTITIGNTPATAPSATGNNINIASGTVQDLLDSINGVFGTATGHGVASLGTGADAGKIMLNGGTANATLIVGGTTAALTSLGLTANTYNRVEAPATTQPPITGATKLANATASPTSDALANDIAGGEKLVVNGKTIQFFDSRLANGAPNSAAGPASPDISYLDVATASVDDVLDAIDAITGATGTAASTVSTAVGTEGKINLSTGSTQDLVLSDVTAGGVADGGTVLAKLGLTKGTTARLSTPATAPAITGDTALSGAVGEDALQSGFAVGNSITVNGTEIKFVASGATGNDVNITDSVDDLLAKIDTITGGVGSKVVNGKIQLNAGDAADLVISDNGVGTLAGSILKKIGLEAGTTKKSSAMDPGLTGKTLTIGATGSSKEPITITFGADDSLGQVSTLDELNKKLAANNLQASISTTGAITLTTTNDAASSDIGALGGTATDPGSVFSGVTINNAVKDPNSQATRASLVSQFNQVIDQIKTTAQDASFNGVNLLSGDTLSLTFNETGKSKLDISGVNFGPEGLGLSTLLSGNDFIDNASTNKILASLNDASTKLRSQASSFGSNLSVVQIRQDFAKNLINVLQTGASNLTLADTNEEAANSQALSTRQSIAVSALSLANQSQQGVLQLLR